MKFLYILPFIFIVAGCVSREDNSSFTENTAGKTADTLFSVSSHIVLDNKQEYYYPSYDNSGERLYVTGPNYKGLWSYSLEGKNLIKITGNDKSGYEYVIGKSNNVYFIDGEFQDDTRRFSYRFQTYDPQSKEIQTRYSTHEILSGLNLINGSTVSFFINDSLVFYSVPEEKFIGTPEAKFLIPKVFGNKLLIYSNEGTKELNPFGESNIVYEDKSPVNDNLLLYAAGKGLHEYSLKDGRLSYIGDYQGAVYSPDGEKIAFFIEENDGHHITGSDIFAILVSKPAAVFNLTNTAETIELNPRWSAGSDKIICNTIDGEIIEIKLNITEKEKANE